jgi:hypothetical protein
MPLLFRNPWHRSGPNAFSNWPSPTDPLSRARLESDVVALKEWLDVMAIANTAPAVVAHFGFTPGTGIVSAHSEPARTFVNYLLLPTWNERANISVAFDEVLFDSKFLRLRDLITEGLLDYVFVTPIALLEIETSPMELENGLTLERLRDVDIIHLLDRGYLPATHGVYGTQTGPTVGLYRTLTRPRGQASDVDPFMQEASKVVDAAHIIAGGTPRPLGTTFTAIPAHLDAAGPDVAISHSELFVRSQGRSTIAAGDAQSLRSAWDAISSGSRPALALAAARLRSGALRGEASEAIVDLMISAEAFFNWSDGRSMTSEQSFRIALRAALFLSDEISERRAIYADFIGAYNARNEVVHGNPPGNPATVDRKKIPLDELVKRIIGHMRLALRRSFAIPELEAKVAARAYWETLLLQDVSTKN